MREMKDSGIEWIGEIPKEWEIIRLCYLIDGYKAGPFGSTLIMDKLDDEGEILVYTPETISTRDTELSTNKYLPDNRRQEMQQFFVEPGDIIFPIVGSLGRAMLIEKGMPEGIINQRLAKFHLSSSTITYPYFMRLFGQSSFFETYIEIFCRGSIIVNLTKAILHDMPVPIPPIKDQERISNFLDKICKEIEMATADIQSQIDTLEQYKRSVITEAVTKGLDKDVEMKESGSQYWGNIPVKWDIVDIKYLFEIVKRIAGHEGYDILSITQHGIKVRDTSTNEGQVAADYSNYQFLYPGEYAMNHMDLLTGWVDLSDKFGVTSPDYRVFRLRDTKRNSRRYYKYIMQICYMCRIFYSLGNGVSNLGRWRLQTSSFNNFKVPVPPYEEQEEISDYLDAKIREIEATIEIKNEQLSTLDIFKKSLIYEYVTGKKEVSA